MVLVWIRDNPRGMTRFHRTKDCRNLRKKVARGTPNELLHVDLNDVVVRPCLLCYPDAPRIKVNKRFCDICQSRYACEHNGGVRVTLRDGRSRYVWPDSNLMPAFRRLSIASTTSND